MGGDNQIYGGVEKNQGGEREAKHIPSDQWQSSGGGDRVGYVGQRSVLLTQSGKAQAINQSLSHLLTPLGRFEADSRDGANGSILVWDPG